jgi:hypothetical protein
LALLAATAVVMLRGAPALVWGRPVRLIAGGVHLGTLRIPALPMGVVLGHSPYKHTAMEIIPVVVRALMAASLPVTLESLYESLGRGNLAQMSRRPGAEEVGERTRQDSWLEID